jgi:hypothetical protein
MKFDSFISGAYLSRSPQVDCQSATNVYPESIAADGGSPAVRQVLVRVPGYELRQTLGDAPGRGKFSVNNRDFAVAGGSFYELLTPTTSILRGAITYGTTPVQMCSNSVQLMILADGKGYIFTFATNAFAQITDPNFPPYAISGCSIDTYFLVLGRATNQFSVSALLDGLTWNGLDFGSSQMPDHSVALSANHLYLWIFGNNSIIIFQDTGNASFPFQRVPGSQIEMGLSSPLTIQTLDNTLFWLGASSRGPAVVYRADGFLPTRISTFAIESTIQSYTTLEDAVSSTYEEHGHLFYRLDFPSANGGAGATHLYDVAEKKWHERAYWNLDTGTYSADRARYHSFCFNRHLVLDYLNGNVYDQSLAYTSHAGNPIRWVRAAPHISDGGTWLFYGAFQLLMQTGMGLDGAVQGSNPLVYLRWSNDGGMSWSDYHEASCGKLGEYLQRVIWRRLGRARSRVFEVSGSDPITKLVLMGAELDVVKGMS